MLNKLSSYAVFYKAHPDHLVWLSSNDTAYHIIAVFNAEETRRNFFVLPFPNVLHRAGSNEGAPMDQNSSVGSNLVVSVNLYLSLQSTSLNCETRFRRKFFFAVS